jgi:predicted GNAT family N-acyltransferase
MKGHLVIKRVQWRQREADLKRLRQEVFVEEQGVPVAEEWDGKDAAAAHFLALFDNKPVACARLQPSGKIERMAVAAPLRGMGIGTALLKGVIAFARKYQLQDIYVDAQTHALGFYQAAGFEAHGEEFKDAGILHRRMHLSAATPVPQDVADSPRLSGPHDSLQALQILMAGGRNSVDILSDQLTPVLYSDEAVIAGLTAIALRSPRSRVRILVKDPRPLQANRHDLVQLARRLPSRISLRVFRPELEQPAESHVIVDREALLCFKSEASFAGYSRRSARAEAQRLLEDFERLWEHYSCNDPNLRQLHI